MSKNSASNKMFCARGFPRKKLKSWCKSDLLIVTFPCGRSGRKKFGVTLLGLAQQCSAVLSSPGKSCAPPPVCLLLCGGGVRAAQANLLPLEAAAEAIAAAAVRVLRRLGAQLASEDLVAFLAGVIDLLTILADPALVLATFALR